MAFNRPTLARLIKRAQSDIESRLAGVTAKIKETVEYVLARVQAGLVHTLHGHVAYIALQILPDTAEGDNLLRWGEIIKTPRNQATKALGLIQVTGTPGAPIPINTQLQVDDISLGDPPTYVSTVAFVMPGAGVGLLNVEAEEPGAAGNLPAGSIVAFVSPVPNIDPTGTVSVDFPLADGNDIEPLDPDYRERVLFNFRNPPKGGGPGDYVGWALSVSGVTRAGELGNVPFPGAVTILIVNDNQNPITPTPGLIAAVQTFIESVAPITATPFVEAPTLVPLDPDIALDDDTPELRSAVTAELIDLLRQQPFGEARPDDYELKIAFINEAIANAPGYNGHTLNAPLVDQTYADKEVPVLGTITWS